MAYQSVPTGKRLWRLGDPADVASPRAALVTREDEGIKWLGIFQAPGQNAATPNWHLGGGRIGPLTDTSKTPVGVPGSEWDGLAYAWGGQGAWFYEHEPGTLKENSAYFYKNIHPEEKPAKKSIKGDGMVVGNLGVDGIIRLGGEFISAFGSRPGDVDFEPPANMSTAEKLHVYNLKLIYQQLKGHFDGWQRLRELNAGGDVISGLMSLGDTDGPLVERDGSRIVVNATLGKILREVPKALGAYGSQPGLAPIVTDARALNASQQAVAVYQLRLAQYLKGEFSAVYSGLRTELIADVVGQLVVSRLQT